MTEVDKTSEASDRSGKNKPVFSRVMIKLSGEAFMDSSKGSGIDTDIAASMAEQLAEVHDMGIQLALIVGGGNIFRGVAASSKGMDRATADYMGMLATVLNALALQEALERKGVYTRVQSAISMREIAEPYIRRRALRHLEKNRIVLFAAGTGNPYFSTDTAAALRALEIGAEAIIKATKVDGVYDRDPIEHSDAKMFRSLSYLEVLTRELQVMDATAVSLCMDNNLPIIVFNLFEKGNLKRLCCGEPLGTIVKADA